jgi:two-component system chemotaxis response regulator CheB
MQMVAVGASAGGLEALRTLVRGLPVDFKPCVVIVQHRAKDSFALAELLQDCTSLSVSEVEDKQFILPGEIYLAPPDYHLLVEPGHFALSTEAPVVYSRPSIDVTFDTAAEAYGKELVGVVLTGANRDGSRGLAKIVAQGGRAIVQDPASAEVRTMPAAAAKAVPAACILSIDDIAPFLVKLQTARHTPCAKAAPG